MTNQTTKPARTALLEALLLWEGRLNNARIREIFDLKDVRASEWIREFREQHPTWVTWYRQTKSFRATGPLYRNAEGKVRERELRTSLTKYLNLVGLPYAVLGGAGENAIWAAFPDLSVPSPRIFAVLNEAIRVQQVVRITYMSMNEPVCHARTISPHSLVQAGRRWHVRAWSTEHQQFRDYALGRIAAAEMLDAPAEKRVTDDEAWQAKVQVRLEAHPDLTEAQRAVIRFEYFNDTAARTETCRGALVNYFIQDLRAATNHKAQKPPEYQLVVSNMKEVEPWLWK